MSLLKNKSFIRFVVKFLLLFVIFYYGTIAWIGFAAPDGFYVPFIDHYLDYVSWIKISLMKGAAFIASLYGYSTAEEPNFLVRVVGARGVYIAYDCVGYGVYSFWAAFVIATTSTLAKKMFWLIGGILLLWLINVFRIGLFLVAINKGWAMPLGLDHHTWFNIFAYGAIFLMVYFFDKNTNQTKEPTVL